MEQAITNLGTPELHKRHSVMIEGGRYPRSKVMDQFVFDRYLMEGIISLTHHRSAEHLLGMATKANIWAKGANMDGGYVDGPKKSKIFFGMMPFGNALNRIRIECGEHHCYIVKSVIIANKDIRQHDQGIKFFRRSMDFVNDNLYSFHRNPLRHLK